MSPKKEISKLQSMCIKRIASLLVYALSDEKFTYKRDIEKYLSNATFFVLQDLLKHILNSENLDASTRFNSLRLLLKENVQILETGIFPYSYYVKILKVIIKSGTGLHQLNLKGLWVHDQPELLEELLDRLKNLKVLIIPHISGDFLLKSVAECSQLSVLDISGECSFSAEELCAFKSSSIKTLIIGSCGKTYLCEPEEKSCETLANIIENLPNLTAIRTYSYIGASLLKIYEKNPSFKSKLIYLHDNQTTIDTCNAIVSICPNLQSVYFDFPKGNVLSYAKELKFIHSIKLSRFEYNELVDYLEHLGLQINYLQLYNYRDIPIDLSNISLVCPNLFHLDCYRINLKVSQPCWYFMCLQSLDILYCNVDDSIVKYLLTNCPFLKRIAVGDVLRMTDGDFFRLCAECEFLYLEELWLSCAKYLTITSVQLLMGHCPQLRSLGQLSGWDVSPTDVEHLRIVIVSNNSDLVLLPTSYP